jgi:hypothetical protein
MAEPSIDVDKLVREVLASLGAAPEPSSPDVEEQESAPAGPSESNGELVVLSQVVTMSELEGRLGGVRGLIVPPGAIVTPSVRDELHRKNIRLVFDQPVPVATAGSVHLVVAVLGSRYDPAPLVRALQGEGITVQTHQTDCLVAATDLLAGEVVKENTLGLVVSTYPAAALCLANRHQGVRAVLGSDAATVITEAASVGANVLVVNARTTGHFQMRQIVSRFCREGPRECPEALRQRLG